MARPKEHGPRITTAIRLAPKLHAQVRKAAAERDLSVNYLVVKALEDFLPRLRPASDLTLTVGVWPLRIGSGGPLNAEPSPPDGDEVSSPPVRDAMPDGDT